MYEFDINNNDRIRQLTNNRKEGAYVMPLYIKIYNSIYDIRDIDSITNYTPSSLKIGYGAMYGMFCKNQFPIKNIDQFNIVKQFIHSDYERNVDILYIVFEESSVDEEMNNHPMLGQINYYFWMINDYLLNRMKVLREQRIRDAFNEANF